jgi:hypothetical protein
MTPAGANNPAIRNQPQQAIKGDDMKSRRIFKTTAVVGAAALILGAFVAGPADAKKKKKVKKPAVCAPYTPAEQGAGAPITVVTDTATAEAPMTAKLTATQGIGTGTGVEEIDAVTMSQVSHVYANVQVDSAAAGTALNIRLEMPETEDYDLVVLNPDGSEAASAQGFNPEPTVYNDNTNGGHTEVGAEVIDALPTNDCQGYTLDIKTASGMGGELTVKYWLGG